MKKSYLILISFILLILIIVFLVVTNDQTFYLDDEYYNNSDLQEIESKELKILENDKKTFVVYVYQPFCSTSDDLDNYLTDFIGTYKITFYKILFSNIKDTTINKYVKYCPSVVIYYKGKIVSYLDASLSKDADYYKSTENFKNWFTRYVILK